MTATADPFAVGDALSIGQVAEQTGLSVHALRWFEREGLFLRSIPRVGGRRTFDSSDVVWLTLCNRLRASGMPIAEIRRFAALVQAGPGNEAERLALLVAHERHVRSQLAELQQCLDIIHSKVESYERHLAEGTAATLWAPPFTEDSAAQTDD
jgi:DNA-binding transcriptional MerR regulator